MRRLVVCLVVMGLVLPASVWAQGGGGGGGGFGGGNRQQSPKMQLGRLLRDIGELEKANKKPLTKDQAKKIVAAIKPWEKKPKMTDEDAKALRKTINDILTTAQKNELDKMAAQNRRMGGGGPGGGGPGGGGFGGAGGGGGQPNPQQQQQFRQTMQKMQEFFKTYNPFYPPNNYKELKELPERFREGFVRRYEARKEILTKLEKKAK